MTKRLSLLLIFIILTALFSGCAAQEGGFVATVVVTATPTERPTDAKTVLRVGTGDSGEGLTPHLKIIEMFEAENPDIQVQLEPVGSGDYYARILTQIAAGDPPDLLQIGDDAVPMFVDKGAFLPLDDFIADAQYPLDVSIYLPGVMEPGQWNGAQYLLPKDFSPLAIYYNKKLFDEAGVAYPQEGWTWDDLLATAQQLTKTDASGNVTQWGIQLPGPWTTGFEYWVAAAGGRLISEDGTTFAGYMDSPEVQAAAQFYADLYNKYKVAPLPADMNAFGGGNSEFDSGRAAMRLFGRWPQSGMKDNPNIELGVAPLPADVARAGVLFWGGFGISSLTENPEAAWRFLRYYTGAEGAEVWKDWALPTVKSVAESSGLSSDPIEGVWLNELNHLAPRAYVFTPYWGQTADPALRRVLESVILDPNANVAELLDAAAQEAQASLDDLRE
ncbi:MAG: sugar ABC transporter substrate-binding protein [Caldilinea sp.]|uniref:ABC transporter substrate-binding protein n=1 Tax=Caldilinea sp. TaxID=2293560 RepID=UPI002B8A91FF|nr:sugar ABC transporter substrate-binding protein [Anaerolineales bacterium]HQY92783.1 sugar ABC transporter substrate-binding protein [Caldilinea sp.]HRA65508.1 sugar ABC transporter substrate-binding protein [Caldilinea sp.]